MLEIDHCAVTTGRSLENIMPLIMLQDGHITYTMRVTRDTKRSRQNNSSAVYERAFESAMRSDRGVLPAYLPSKVSARPRSTSTSASAEIHSVSSSTETQRVVEPPVDMDELLSAIKNERMRDLVDGLD